jgi:signal transduction histidine kinase
LVLDNFNLILVLYTLFNFVTSFYFVKQQKPMLYINFFAYILNNVGFLLLVISLFWGIFCKKRYFILFSISSSILIYGFLSYLLNTLNLISLPIIKPGNIINGMAVEISLLTVFFGYKYKIEREGYVQQIINKAELNESLTKKLLEIQEFERKTIAENLHDEVGSGLTGLRLLLQNSLKNSNIPVVDQQKMLTTFNDLYQNVRTISHQLIPKELITNSFLEVIEAQIDLHKSNFSDINFEFITNINEDFKLNDDIEINLYRSFLEILSNAIQHSEAKKIEIQLIKDEHLLLLIIEDDGIGFDKSSKKLGIGIQNVKSRIDYLKGKLTIESNKLGSTFIIELEIE